MLVGTVDARWCAGAEVSGVFGVLFVGGDSSKTVEFIYRVSTQPRGLLRIHP